MFLRQLFCLIQKCIFEQIIVSASIFSSCVFPLDVSGFFFLAKSHVSANQKSDFFFYHKKMIGYEALTFDASMLFE